MTRMPPNFPLRESNPNQLNDLFCCSLFGLTIGANVRYHLAEIGNM